MLVQEVYNILLLHPYFSKLSESQRYSALNTALSNLEVKELEYEVENLTEVVTTIFTNDFSSTSGWSVGTGASVTGGVLRFASATNQCSVHRSIIVPPFSEAVIMTLGVSYRLEFNISSLTSGGVYLYLDSPTNYNGNVVSSSMNWTQAGDCYVDFVANETNLIFRAFAASNNTLDITNVTISQAATVGSNITTFEPVKYDNKLITGNSVKFPWALTTKQKLFILNIALTRLGDFRSSKYEITNVGSALTYTKEYKNSFLSELKWKIFNSLGIITNSSDRTEVGSTVRIEKSFYLTLQNTLNSSVVAARIEKVLEGVLGCTLSWKYGLQKVYNLNLDGIVSYVNRQATKESDLSLSASVNWGIYGTAQFTKEDNLTLGSTVSWVIT